MKKEIGKKIKETREEQGLSQYMLASKAQLHQVIVRNIEECETAYSIDSLVKTCDVLGLAFQVVDKMLTDDQKENDTKD